MRVGILPWRQMSEKQKQNSMEDGSDSIKTGSHAASPREKPAEGASPPIRIGWRAFKRRPRTPPIQADRSEARPSASAHAQAGMSAAPTAQAGDHAQDIQIPTPSSPTEMERGLDYFFQILIAKWRLGFLVIVFALLAGVLYVRTRDPFYEAVSTIEMTVRRPRILKIDEAIIEEGERKSVELLNTRLHILKGQDIRDRVFNEFRAVHPEIAVSEDHLRAAVSDVHLTQVRSTFLVNISLLSGIRELVVPVVNTYARVAVDSVKDALDQKADAAMQWLQEQLAGQRGKAEETQAALAGFREKNELDKIESEKEALEQSLDSLNGLLVETKAKTTFSQTVLEGLANKKITPETSGELPTYTPHLSDIESVRRELKRAVKQRDIMRLRYTDEHPKVKELAASIEALQDEFYDSIERARKAAEVDQELIEKHAQRIRAMKVEQEERLAAVEKRLDLLNTELDAMRQKRDTERRTSDELMRRIEEARLSAEEHTALVTLVQLARNQPRETLPARLRMLAVAALLGLLCACALCYFSYNYEDLVSNMSALEEHLGIPVMGVVPRVAGNPKTQDLCASHASEKFDALHEAFAGIRTTLNVRMRNVSQSGATIVVTGTLPHEGKTSTCCNLATTYSRSGERTLLVDCDLRRPFLHKVFAVSGETPSFVSAIEKGTAEAFRELPRKTEIANLDVILGNGPVNNEDSPSGILSSAGLKAFLRWARKEYTNVIIDTPPIGVFSDALILASVGDAVVLVCRCDKSRKKVLRHALLDLRRNGGNVLGVIICDFPRNRLAARLGYGRYYDYKYYHYDYYRDYQKSALG